MKVNFAYGKRGVEKRDRKGKAKVFWFPNECKNGDFYQL